jgi:uncharacterized protein
MSNPFSPAFLEQLREKQKAAAPASATPASATPSSAAPPATEAAAPPAGDIREIKDSHGRLIQRIPFKDGKIDGVMESYNPDTEKLTHKVPYSQGVIDGTVIAYDAHEKIIQEVPYAQGQKKGVAHFYHLGAKTADITFDQDQMNGPAIFYGPNEIIHTLATYKDGQFEGEFRAFDTKKNILRQCTYTQGLLNGPSKLFYPSGEVPDKCKIFEECLYKDNKIQGEQLQYFPDGTLMKRTTYNADGKPIKEETFSPKGEKESEKEIDPTPQKAL